MSDSFKFDGDCIDFGDYNKGAFMNFPLPGAAAKDKIVFSDMWGNEPDDRVNSPSHYTAGTQEAIEIIEEAIDAAPSNKLGMLQAQVLKYLLRLWLKDNPLEDARKGRWYLERLINHLEG